MIDSFEQDMAQALEVVRVERDEAETTVEELRSQVCIVQLSQFNVSIDHTKELLLCLVYDNRGPYCTWINVCP